MKLYYFGCIEDTGHHLFEATAHVFPRKLYNPTGPWGWKIDGGLCPPGNQPQGVAALHHKDGWTALAFWDFTVDSRPGSNSAFLADATLDFDAMLALAREKFPKVVARFPFEITPAGRAALTQEPNSK